MWESRLGPMDDGRGSSREEGGEHHENIYDVLGSFDRGGLGKYE